MAVFDVEAQARTEIVRGDLVRPQIRNRVVGNADITVDSATTLVFEEIAVLIPHQGGELGVTSWKSASAGI